ncbi:hypothetical protein GBAR_LOCUS18671 [Geodia barretti]|uniref:Uncharacterized protein n=1 Tax=Geodia barretti TaxID=519541 RepID=A0AA35SN12_GEOBA|nr:hypothetical protein GBAR_LOCUS18671 [Geodia barretti]
MCAVYHLLSAEQLNQWEQYEYEYYADELTFQGVTKRRRKILTEAGLLFDSEKEKARLEVERRQREEEEARERERRQKELQGNPLFKSTLSVCQEEREQLRKDLEELTGKIRGVIKDFPAVAYRLGFLQNFTDSRGKYGDTPAPVEEERVAVDDHGAVEVAAVVVDGREREGEREEGEEEEEGEQREWSRGGFLDHNEVDEAQLDNILKEINEEVEERDALELRRELSELPPPKKNKPRKQDTEGERGEERGREIETDEQLLELVEQLQLAQQQPA